MTTAFQEGKDRKSDPSTFDKLAELYVVMQKAP